jgi:hypothetical protein
MQSKNQLDQSILPSGVNAVDSPMINAVLRKARIGTYFIPQRSAAGTVARTVKYSMRVSVENKLKEYEY